MSMLRELGGWTLLALVGATPFVALVALIAVAADGEVPFWYGSLCVAMVLGWPAALLQAWRWLSADPVQVAEADGRPPVLVLHGFTQSQVPLYRRILPTSALIADWRDQLYARAVARGLRGAGPVLPFARPTPPPGHGPVISQRDRVWEAALDDQIQRARIVAIVLDGTEANAREIERAFALRAARSVVLIPPARIDAAFLRRWEALKARIFLPQRGEPSQDREDRRLPDLDPSAVAVRFSLAGVPMVMSAAYGNLAARQIYLRQPKLMLLEGEAEKGPAPPLASWVFTMLPIPVAFIGAIATPLALEGQGIWHLRGGEVVGWGMALMVISVVLAGLGRRTVALVPRGELSMIFLSVLPWLLSMMASSGSSNDLKETAIAAAYSAPLLFGTALVLVTSLLIRHAPGREVTYAIFGFAAMLPFATLAATLDVPVEALALTVIAGGFVLGLVTMSASGEASRRHAPLPLGAACAATLGIAAWYYAVSTHAWRGAVGWANQGGFYDAPVTGALETFSTAWPWFSLAIPAVVVLIALPFRGRANRSSVLGVFALLPVLLVFGLATGVQARARGQVHARLEEQSGAVFDQVRIGAVAPNLAPVAIHSSSFSPGPIDWVVDDGGVIARGERISTASAMLSSSGWAGPGFGREVNRFSREGGGTLRITADGRTESTVVGAAIRSAHQAGIDEVQLVGADSRGAPVGVALVPEAWAARSGDPLHLWVEGDQLRLFTDSGYDYRVLDQGGQPDADQLRNVLSQHHSGYGASYVVVHPRAGTSTARFAQALALVHDSSFATALGR